MWFAGYGTFAENPWFPTLMQRLLEGSPSVRALLADGPFADRPPKYVRAELFDYRFASPGTHAETGAWWERRPAGIDFPEMSLAETAQFAGGTKAT